MMPDCPGPLAQPHDAFCAGHWRRLARPIRVELVRRLKRARRGGKEAVAAYLELAAACRSSLLASGG